MSETKLGSIGQIALHVSDIERSVEFYGEKLGMTKIFDTPNLAFFDNDGVRLMLSSGEGEPSGERSVIYYRVDDIDAVYAEFSSEGVEFQGEPHVVHASDDYELKMAFLKDPDGNQLAIMAERGEL
jgi:catechol 2,3-dioxygenase-like lactoylglutathione lyase family enzyme